MPVIFRYRGYRFLFFSNEGSPREPVPVHVHVDKGDHEAKFWIELAVDVAYNEGFNVRMLRD